MIINNFKLDKKLDAKVNSKKLISFTKKTLSNNYINKNFNIISRIIKVPLNVIENECKHYLQFNFNNKRGKYNTRFSLMYSCIDLFKFISFIMWITFFSKKYKKNTKKKFDIIIDDLDHDHSINTFIKLKEYFSKILLITTIKKYKNDNEFIYFNKYKYLNLNLNLNFFYNYFFYLPLNILILSIKSKNNLFGINLHILKIFFKYSSIFEENEAKFLIQERYYRSSSLKNYLFKKYGGHSVSITQRVLPIYSSFGMFVSCDNFFSLGNQTAEIILKQDSSIKNVIPVGSLTMYQSFFDKKNLNLNELEAYDILDLESRMANFNDVYDTFWQDWYLKFSWLSKLSSKKPNLKIGIKIRPEHSSMMENPFIQKNIQNSNIKIIDGSEHSFKFNTYHYAFKAKSLCTWISTIGFEMLGHGKKCYFVNPDFRNSSYKDLEILNKFTIDSYENFEKKILDEINNSSDQKLLENEKNNFCLNSSEVYSKLANNIKNF